MCTTLLWQILQLTPQTTQQPVNRTPSWRSLYLSYSTLLQRNALPMVPVNRAGMSFKRLVGSLSQFVHTTQRVPQSLSHFVHTTRRVPQIWARKALPILIAEVPKVCPLAAALCSTALLDIEKKNCPGGRFHEGENLVHCVPCYLCPTDAHFGETRDPHCWGLLGISELNLRVKARDEWKRFLVFSTQNLFESIVWINI